MLETCSCLTLAQVSAMVLLVSACTKQIVFFTENLCKMHEIALIESIIDIVSTEMKKHHITQVETIKLRIGEMSHVMPDALVFGFEVLSKDTSLEGSRLIIETVPTRGQCRDCGTEFIIKDIVDICPRCGGISFEIISGKELEIVEFDGL